VFEENRATTGQLSNVSFYATSEAADEAVDAAIQTHGGAGFSRDHNEINVERQIRLLRIAPINNEMLLNYIAEKLLGMPRSY
jgi:acyl-CoA dehydrogenase